MREPQKNKTELPHGIVCLMRQFLCVAVCARHKQQLPGNDFYAMKGNSVVKLKKMWYDNA